MAQSQSAHRRIDQYNTRLLVLPIITRFHPFLLIITRFYSLSLITR